MATARDLTIEHYQRPEVKEAILRYGQDGKAIRALNGDDGWYTQGSKPSEVRLTNPKDYDLLIGKFRTLYYTIDMLDPSVFEISEVWNEERGEPEKPIGTLQECLAFTLSVDIDSIKVDGKDITTSAEIKKATEDAGQFYTDYLRERGITKSVHCLYSGGGIYVHVHHALFKANPKWTPDDRERAYRSLTIAYNQLIAEIEREFFKAYPEHKGRVKFDKLNNQKRKFKAIFSIHKRVPVAVIPLDPEHIEIDFEKARLPLSDAVLDEGQRWYQDYDLSEREALKKLLAPFEAKAEDELKERKERGGNYEIYRSTTPIKPEDFPPCIKAIIEKAEPGKGPHRALAVLAAYLYQAGWSEADAFRLWISIADRVGVEPRIFDQWFGLMCCPNCKTIQRESAGYPSVGLGGLGYCVPDKACDAWPGNYGIRQAFEKISKKPEPEEPKGPNVIDALKVLIDHESEIPKKDTWEWRCYKNQALKAVKDKALTAKDEQEAHKFLGKYKDLLKNYKIEYEDLYPLARKPKPTKEVFSEEIKARALGVLKHGDPLQYVADSCGRMVLGAEKAFKKLSCCISIQNVKQSSGLHPKFSGESSGGKTYTAYTFAHHLPWEAVIKGSMSNKAGFYHKDGDRVLRILDDYQAGNEDLDTIIKQTSSEFHEPYTHRTVTNHQAVTLQIGKEQTWVITSVDSSQDIQVLNRQLPINVDDSIDLTKKVNNRTIERYGKGEEQRPVSEDVLVSRAIFQILRDEGYISVRVPFWDRVEWLDTSNRRNPAIFMDLLIAHTAMNRYQRTKDSEGFYLATEDDFEAAKALFTDRDGEELVKRLTARERDVINLLIGHSAEFDRDEIAVKLRITPDRVSQIIGGQRGSGGLRQKVQLTETKKSISIRTGNKETDDTRHTVFKTVYSLKDYDRFTGFDAVVKLRDIEPPADKPDDNKPAPDKPAMCAMYELCKVLCIQTEMCKPELCKICIRKKEKEKRDIDNTYAANIAEHFSREIQENTYLHSSKATDGERAYIALKRAYIAYIAGVNANGSKVQNSDPSYVSIEEQRRQAEERAQAKEEHDREQAEKHSKPAELRRAEEQREAKEEHFKTPGLKAITKATGEALEYAPYELNIYHGCPHSCNYCYVPGTKRTSREEFKCNQTRIKKASLDNLEYDLENWQGERSRVHLCFLCDPYPMGWDTTPTRETLQLIRKHGHPFQVLTKGDMQAAIRDFDLYGPDDRFGVTLTFTNADDSMEYEPNAAMPSERIEALKAAHERGIKTWVSLEPVIDPAQTLQLIELTHEYVDFYGVGKLNHNAELAKSIDWLKFRADAEELLRKYKKQYKIKQALVNATSRPKKPDPDEPHKLRLQKDYRTQIVQADKSWKDTLYLAGEIIEIPAWKVKDLISKGIAEEVEA